MSALFLFAASQATAPATADTQVELSPAQPYQAERFKPVTYDVDFSVVVTPPAGCRKLAVWLPVPPSDAMQTVTESRLSSFPIRVEPRVDTEPAHGNRFAYFEFQSPLGAQIVRHQFRVNVWEGRWNVDSEKTRWDAKWPASFTPYLRGDSQSVILDERFEKLLGQIVPDKAAPATGMRDIMSWVQANFEYDHHDASLRASAEHAISKRRGHCSDYHGFCASMGRALGVPTRVAYGINTFPKQSPSHCKLEAFLPPYGWVMFDVSETQKQIASLRKATDLDEPARQRLIHAAERRLALGFRDNTWIRQTCGTDYDLVPKASRKVPVVRTAWIEADGVPLPDPDPADKAAKGLAWMTVHSFQADRPHVPYPFTDRSTLETQHAE